MQPVISLVVKGISGRGVRRAGAGYIDKRFLVPLHPLSNIKITKYFSYKPRFNCVFSTNNLPRIRDGAYDIISVTEKLKEHIGFHYLLTEIHLGTLILWSWIYSSGSIKQNQRSITHNIFRIQDKDSIMWAFYCIGSIGYILAGKTLLHYTNLFSLNDLKEWQNNI